VERDKTTQSESVGQTFPIAMETKKGWFKNNLDSFHQTSWNFVGISTVVYGSFWGVEKNQNGGRCYGYQGAKKC
jgi:hypothetical protein